MILFKSLLLNPKKYDVKHADQEARKIMTKTMKFFEDVVDSRYRNYEYVKDIEMPSINQASVGAYEMIEYLFSENDILTKGDQAFADNLYTVNICKFQLRFAALWYCISCILGSYHAFE